MSCLGRGTIVFLLAVASLVALPDAARSATRSDSDLESSILRVKPAVVLISSEVAAEVTLRCGPGAARTVTPDPQYEIGSGFIIHPDGYIATNGHVVANFYEKNEKMLGADFLQAAAAEACGPALAMLPDGARKERLRAILADPANRGQLRLKKKLQVHLSSGKIFEGEVKAYSPAINPNAPPADKVASGDMGPMEQSGKDVAIIKIAAKDLPTVRLAATSTGLQLGEQIFILGYPGVVLHHDFLSRKSALEASVTVGRVSGFKIDITDRRVIQTDAAISWGNSGGPAFNLHGEVIGAATFISTTLEGDQAIQGFNFLIPVETAHEFARGISLIPTADSPFTQTWERAVGSYFSGEYRRAAAHVEEADRLMPGFPDVMRLRSETQLRADRQSGFGGRSRKVGIWLGGGLGVVLLALGVRSVVNTRIRRSRGLVRRVTPEEIRGRLEAGAPVAILDARHGGNFDDSPVQVAGAMRYDVDRPSPQPLQVQVAPNGEVVAYCD